MAPYVAKRMLALLSCACDIGVGMLWQLTTTKFDMVAKTWSFSLACLARKDRCRLLAGTQRLQSSYPGVVTDEGESANPDQKLDADAAYAMGSRSCKQKPSIDTFCNFETFFGRFLFR